VSYAPSPNFSFLVEYDARLVAAPTSAERALSIDDAVGALVHLRRFGEHLAQNAAAELGVHDGAAADQVDRLRALKRTGVDEQILQMFHSVRKVGNRAVHDGEGSQSDAFHHLKIAHQLAIWFFRTVRRAPGFKPAPLVPPARLVGETAELRQEIEDLTREAEAREEERDEAQAAAEAELKKRVGAEEAARKLEEDKAFYEAYAAEQDALRC
jgi:type I restriction enzyme R subunit